MSISRMRQIDHIVDRYEQLLASGADVDADQFLQDVPDDLAVDVRAEIEEIKKETIREQRIPDSGSVQSSLPDRYEFRKPIASGGMGEVVEVWDRNLERVLALKSMRAGPVRSAELRQRFLREAQVTGTLQHPGIPPVVETGDLPDGTPFFTLKLVRGETLSKLIENTGQNNNTLTDLLSIFEQITEALAYAHQRSIVHRDIKPDNIMVGQFGEVHVMDWGMAYRVDDTSLSRGNESEDKADAGGEGSRADADQGHLETTRDAPKLTQHGSVFGTPAFMPPEQASGACDLDAPTLDVFALGGVLLSMLARRQPFRGVAGEEIMRRLRAGDSSEHEQLLKNANVDDELKGIARSCLAMDPTQRPADAAEVRKLIREYRRSEDRRLEEQRLATRAAVVRLHEQTKRQRLMYLAGGFLMLLIVGLVAFSLLIRSKNNELTDINGELTTVNGKLTDKNSELTELNQQLIIARDEETVAKIQAIEYGRVARAAHEGSQAVYSFLDREVFDSDEVYQLGPEARISDIVDKAIPKISAAFQEAPLAEGRIRCSMTKVLLQLGRAKDAHQQARLAVDLLSNEISREHTVVIRAKILLMRSLNALGRQREVVALGKETLADLSYEKKWDDLDANDVLRYRVMISTFVARGLVQSGKPREAIELFDSAIRDCETMLGHDNWETLHCKVERAILAHRTEGNQDSADALATAVSAFGESLPENSENVFFYLDVGRTLVLMGQLSMGMPLLSDALVIAQRTLGRKHPASIRSVHTYSLGLVEQEQYSTASSFLLASLDDVDEVLGPASILSGNIRLALLQSLVGESKVDQAILEFNRWYKQTWKTTVGDRCFSNHVMFLARNGYRTQAIGQVRTAIEMVDQTPNLDVGNRSFHKTKRIENLVFLGEYEAAMLVIDDVLSQISYQYAMAFKLDQLFADCLLGANRIEDAQKRWLENRPRLDTALKGNPKNALLAEINRQNLIGLLFAYRKLGDEEKAEGIQQQIDRLKAAIAEDKAEANQPNETKLLSVADASDERVGIKLDDSTLTVAGRKLGFRRLLAGDLALRVPTAFQLMAPEVLRFKYPNRNRPDYVFTDETGGINVTVRLGRSPIDLSVKQLQTHLHETFKNLFPSGEFLAVEMIEVGGKQWALLDIRHPTIDTKVRNLMMVGKFRGRMLQVTFNCVEEKEKQWVEVGRAILESCRLASYAQDRSAKRSANSTELE